MIHTRDGKKFIKLTGYMGECFICMDEIVAIFLGDFPQESKMKTMIILKTSFAEVYETPEEVMELMK